MPGHSCDVTVMTPLDSKAFVSDISPVKFNQKEIKTFETPEIWTLMQAMAN